MRNLGLDLLRVFAVLLVMGRHLQIPPDANALLQAWHRGGWVGVDVFFVLSGFLVSGLLFHEHRKTGTIRRGRFLIRRGFRIYPAFYLFLGYSLWLYRNDANGVPPERILGELLFLQNYLGAIWVHTWSLAVEEHFYLLLAVGFPLLLKLRSDGFDRLPLIFGVVAVVCLGLRAVASAVEPEFLPFHHLYPTHLRMDGLFFGVLLGYLFHHRDLVERIRWVPSWALLLAGGAMLAPAFLFEIEETPWIPVFGLALFSLGSGCLLLAAIRWERSDLALVKGVGALGAASYSIYLWHVAVEYETQFWIADLAAEGRLSNPWALYAAVYLTLSFALGLLMNKLVEYPTLKVRDRLFPRPNPERPV